MKLRDRLLVKKTTSSSLSFPEGGEGRGEEGRVDWISPLPDPLPTPASWGEGNHRAVSPIPQSPEYVLIFLLSFLIPRPFSLVLLVILDVILLLKFKLEHF